ncbi:hypothetical protein RIN58_09735 [Siccibacter colletis]|uniref:hypothetical protein n=1 Tax=Siccibacter colletis TaxID=1505757 RepID=UPI0028BE6F95|nr:hypothetical protein [Siccibacter colletis]WNN50347.1 hypothetical protein RIN58_09735 [Siccibacter colletis]
MNPTLPAFGLLSMAVHPQWYNNNLLVHIIKQTKGANLFLSKIHFINLVFVISFWTPQQSVAVNLVKYLAEFKTVKSGCMARINGFPVINNFFYSSGTVTTGFNVSSFLENGSNEVGLMMGPIDPNDNKTLFPDSRCEIIITTDGPASRHKITTLVLSVDQRAEINARSSSSYHGGASESRVDETQTKADVEQNLHSARRQIKVTDIPQWAWANATPVSDKVLPELIDVYKNIWTLLNNRDIATLKSITSISSFEMSLAEGLPPEVIFESYDLPQNVGNEDLAPVKLEFEKYFLRTYSNGRVFRLIDGIYENSPLRLQNKEGEIVYSYNPYFALINGKIVIVR